MIIKNYIKILEYREEILDTKPMETKYGIRLPPVFKSFYSVYKPYFLVEKYKSSNNGEHIQFTKLIYSSQKSDSYTHDDDEFALDSFKELEELLTFEPSNKGHLKDLLFIGNHGYFGGLLVGIGEDNADKIYMNIGPKPVIFIAENIFELIHKMVVIHTEFDEPWIDK